MTADLHRLGYTEQTNIDFAGIVIRDMEAKYRNLGATWEVMDVRQMDFGNESFDIALDKSTLDCMFHGSMWDPPDDVRDNINKYLSEVDRVLVPGGTFHCITFRQPHFIKPLLVREKVWTLDVRTLSDSIGGPVFDYFLYVMVKHGADYAETEKDSG